MFETQIRKAICFPDKKAAVRGDAMTSVKQEPFDTKYGTCSSRSSLELNCVTDCDATEMVDKCQYNLNDATSANNDQVQSCDDVEKASVRNNIPFVADVFSVKHETLNIDGEVHRDQSASDEVRESVEAKLCYEYFQDVKPVTPFHFDGKVISACNELSSAKRLCAPSDADSDFKVHPSCDDTTSDDPNVQLEIHVTCSERVTRVNSRKQTGDLVSKLRIRIG